MIITSKTDSYTKAHGKYLEWYCTEQARRVGRYHLDNANDPKKPKITEVIEAELLDNIDTIKVLLSTYGYPLLEEFSTPSKKQQLFYCKGKSAKASGIYTADGFLVLRGSTCNFESTPSWEIRNKRRRDLLVEDGILLRKGDVYEFTEDYLFSSPSNASSTVLARSSNGWTSWKDSKGLTLDESVR